VFAVISVAPNRPAMRPKAALLDLVSPLRQREKISATVGDYITGLSGVLCYTCRSVRLGSGADISRRPPEMIPFSGKYEE
jgi:hypothetical protein